jgi:hypothetical protein
MLSSLQFIQYMVLRIYFFFKKSCFGGTGVWTQGFMLAGRCSTASVIPPALKKIKWGICPSPVYNVSHVLCNVSEVDSIDFVITSKVLPGVLGERLVCKQDLTLVLWCLHGPKLLHLQLIFLLIGVLTCP